MMAGTRRHRVDDSAVGPGLSKALMDREEAFVCRGASGGTRAAIHPSRAHARDQGTIARPDRLESPVCISISIVTDEKRGA